MNKPFLIQRRVQFCETDLAGVLHFSNYYRYMEEAEHEFLRSVELKVVTSDGAREISWPRVATSCEYFAPCRFDDVVDLAVTLLSVGDRAVTYEIEFRLGDKRIAAGKATAVIRTPHHIIVSLCRNYTSDTH